MANFIPSPFVGTFFFVTRNSSYEVEVRDASSSPLVTKMTTPRKRVLLRGLILAIGNRTVAKYDFVPRYQPDGYLPWIGSKDTIVKSTSSLTPIAFFSQNDETFQECIRLSENAQTFDPRWEIQTVATLRMIGLRHPCISIATEGPYALPRHILNCLASPPKPVMGLPTNSRGKGSVKFLP